MRFAHISLIRLSAPPSTLSGSHASASSVDLILCSVLASMPHLVAFAAFQASTLTAARFGASPCC